jgi:hypothetical protein
MGKFFIKLLLFVILILGISCDSNDASSFNQNHHRLEFDLVSSKSVKKRIGVANILISDEENLEDRRIIFNLIHKGTISIISPTCNVSIQEKFDSKFILNLNEIFKEKKSCQYLIIAESKNDSLKNFSLFESGIINIIYKNKKLEDMLISYNNFETKNYSFTNEGSIQIRSSYESTNSQVGIIAPIDAGFFEISGCSKILKGEFRNKKFNFSLKNFYKSKLILRSDSCLLNMRVFNSENVEVSEGFLYINIFDSKTILAKKLNFELKNNILEVKGNTFEVICSINNSFILYPCTDSGVTCSAYYEEDSIYWIRGITKLGRKSIFAIKNGKIIWEE